MASDVPDGSNTGPTIRVFDVQRASTIRALFGSQLETPEFFKLVVNPTGIRVLDSNADELHSFRVFDLHKWSEPSPDFYIQIAVDGLQVAKTTGKKFTLQLRTSIAESSSIQSAVMSHIKFPATHVFNVRRPVSLRSGNSFYYGSYLETPELFKLDLNPSGIKVRDIDDNAILHSFTLFDLLKWGEMKINEIIYLYIAIAIDGPKVAKETGKMYTLRIDCSEGSSSPKEIMALLLSAIKFKMWMTCLWSVKNGTTGEVTH